MKTWEKVMLCILLPFAYLWHGMKKSAKYMGEKLKPAVSLLVAATMLLSVMPMTAVALETHNHSVRDAAYKEKFTSDNSAYEVQADGNNLKLAVPHIHNYTYTHSAHTANMEQVIEICDCGHKATATLEMNAAVSTEYNRTEIEPLKVVFSDNWAGNKPTEITYSNNINAGIASGSLTINGTVATRTFTISPASAPSITFPKAVNPITYGQKLKDAGLTFTENEYGTFDWVAPDVISNAGNGRYAVDFRPSDDALKNYDWVSLDKQNGMSWIEERSALCAMVDVTVNKATPEYIPPANVTATYGDTLEDVTLPNGWSWRDPLSTSVGNVGTKTFKAIFTPTDTNNYNTVAVDVPIIVGQADSICTAPTAKENLVYNGEKTELVNAGSVFGGEMQYTSGTASEPIGSWNADIPVGRSAGTYYVWYKVVGDGNYKDVAPVCIEVTIGKAPLTVTANNKTITYGDAPVNSGVTYDGFVSTENEDVLYGTLGYDYSYSQYGNVGDYDITPKGLTSDNYEIIFQKGRLTVEQKEIGISWGGTEFLRYTGERNLPKVSAMGLVNGDTCALTTAVVETAEGAGIIPGRWHASIVSLSNQNYCLPKDNRLVTVEYGIVNGSQNAPTVSGVAETIKGKADGKISGLTTEMEYSTEYTADDDKYTKITDPNMTFAAGTYYVRYCAKQYYNAGVFAEVTITEGRKLTVNVPAEQSGYELKTVATELDWHGSTTLTFTLAEGYTKTNEFSVSAIGAILTDNGDGIYTVSNAQDDIVITVVGVADITPPKAEIFIKDNKWTQFWNSLTFGLVFNETQDVTIKANDNGSDVNTIEYYLAGGEMERYEVESITDWKTYDGTFKIDPNNRYVVYAKVTDNAGNVEYVNSDGVILDDIAPTLEGIENGKTYYGDLTVIKSDEQFYDIKIVTLDGEPMSFAEGTYGLIPANNTEHTVIVEDHAGNKTTYVVMVYKNYTVTYKADGETVSTETVGHGLNATLQIVPAKDGYVGKWDSEGKNITADMTINAVYTAIPVVKPEEVKPEDKTDFEDTKSELEEEQNKPVTDLKSPQTSDISYKALWLALFFISGGVIITLTVIDRKRRNAVKH